MNNENIVRNIFIAIMLITVIAGWDIARMPVPEASARMDYEALQTAPSEVSEVTKIKVGEVVIRETPDRNFITVKVSHYWPDLGGVNCLTFKNGKCVSKMANGQPWENHIDKAIACPRELKMGTKIKVLGKTWTCMDRGGMIIKTEDDKYWIDMLTEKAVVPYGHEVKAEVL